MPTLDPWMTSLLSTSVGWALGLMSAFGLEYYKTRKRRKAVASTLLAEVQRIYLEIFGVDKELEDVRLGSHEIPTAIHPWVERIVLDSADIEPSLVRGFLELDLLLRNRAYLLQKQVDGNQQGSDIHDEFARDEIGRRLERTLRGLEHSLSPHAVGFAPIIGS